MRFKDKYQNVQSRILSLKDNDGLQEIQYVQLHWQHVNLILECNCKY